METTYAEAFRVKGKLPGGIKVVLWKYHPCRHLVADFIDGEDLLFVLHEEEMLPFALTLIRCRWLCMMRRR